MTNKKQDATPSNVATGGNVGRYDNVARQSTAKRNDNTVIKVNVEKCDKYISYLQPQLVNLINELTKLGNEATMKELNEAWDTNFVMTGIYTQDIYPVLSHYLNPRIKYKALDNKTLAELDVLSFS